MEKKWLILQKEIIPQLNFIYNSILTKDITPYVGWLGYNNLGDEILYQAHLELFSKFNLTPFQYSKLIDAYFNISKKKISNVGILGGGTFIFQSDYWLNQVNYLLNNDVKMFCLGTGVASGSFLKKETAYWVDNRHKWIKALSSFIFVGVRGPYSKKMLDEIGYTKAVIVGDTALSLAPDSYTQKETKQGIIGLNIGINNMQSIWGDNKKYVNEVIQLIRELINKDYKVHLLPIFEKDVRSNEELVNLINHKNCKLKINFQSLEGYSSELGKCDLFIGQKLHSTIISCMNRVPSIMVEYNPKCRDFMASIDMEKYVIKTSEFETKKVLKMIGDLFSNYTYIQKKLNTEVKKYKKIQQKQSKLIIDNLYEVKS